MKNKFLAYFLLLIMFVPCVVLARVDETGSSDSKRHNSGGTYSPKDVATLADTTASIRLTVVNQNGDRLTLNVNGKNYTSRTLDFYDYTQTNIYTDDNGPVNNRSEDRGKKGLIAEHNRALANGIGDQVYISCGTVKQGGIDVPTLCMRKEWANVTSYTKLNVNNGSFKRFLVSLGYTGDGNFYNYKTNLERHWESYKTGNGYNISDSVWMRDWALPYGYAGAQGNTIETIFRQFRGITDENSYKMKVFNRIFGDLMGVSITDVINNSSSSCNENKTKLKEAYIIVEPVTRMRNKFNNYNNGIDGWATLMGSGTEQLIFNIRVGKNGTDYSNGKVCNGCYNNLPNLVNAIRITDGDPDFHKSFNFYYRNIPGSLLPPINSFDNRIRDSLHKYNNYYGLSLGALRFSDSSNAASKINCYDYSVDAACTDCDSVDKDNAAYVIQDITNWDAIKSTNSFSGDKACVKNHFVKEGVYCREEFHVSLPNKNNTIYVEKGSYFTLNRNNDDSTISIPNGIQDFRPIRVTKVRQCTGDAAKLNNFKKKSDSQFTCNSNNGGISTGDITIKYDEKVYGTDTKLVSYGSSFNSTIKGNVLTQTVTNYYTLKKDLYRYVRKGDGLSVSEKGENNNYTDLGFGNLPIAFENDEKNINITFKYSLPTCDNYSDMYKVYGTGNKTCDKLKNEGTSNVYKQYVDKGSGDINNSACVKLYGSQFMRSYADFKNNKYSSDEYTAGQQRKLANCIRNRTGNKVGNCEGSIASFGEKLPIKNDESKEYKYLCTNYIDGKPEVCNKDNAAEFGRDWNEKEEYCCPVGTKYNPNTGKCEGVNNNCKIVDGVYYGSKGTVIAKDAYEDECCNKDNATEFGRDYNVDGGYCCSKGTTYNANTKKCETGCEELKCKDGADACCKDENGTAFCGVLRGSNLICGGKPQFDKTVYRVIDPINPLISQSGAPRKAGSNWCTYVSSDGINWTLNCDDDEKNVAVSKILKNNVTDESKALYKVTLDGEAIDMVKAYNKKHSYDDWSSLSCNSRNCVSKFLHDNRSELSLEGLCAIDVNSSSCTG